VSRYVYGSFVAISVGGAYFASQTWVKAIDAAGAVGWLVVWYAHSKWKGGQ
jgi:hypothetical protein